MHKEKSQKAKKKLPHRKKGKQEGKKSKATHKPLLMLSVPLPQIFFLLFQREK